MKKPEVKTFDSPSECARAFGDYLIKAAEKKQQYNCALSGGSTPKILFDYLADAYQGSEVWSKMNFYWGDERCVAFEHEESNFRMAREHLLGKVGVPEKNIHRIMGEADPKKEAERYADELMNFLPFKNEIPILDMIILGLGTDGHTASIFPHEIELITSNNLCEVAHHPDSGQKRITLTARVINGAEEVAFLVTGDNKKEKVSDILNKSGQWIEYPASYVHPISERLTWFVDKAAGALL